MTCYSVGFFFDRDLEKVLLITKARPDWQKGKLNGIGGHVERGESFRFCMKREFYEETGIDTFETDWTKVATLCKDGQFEIEFFKARGLDPYWKYGLKPQPDEPIAWYPVEALPHNVIFNLRYLIMLALDSHLEYPVILRNK
jgi:8-oxo-dGTP diphosphatase